MIRKKPLAAALALLVLTGGFAIIFQGVNKPASVQEKGIPLPPIDLPRFTEGAPKFTTADVAQGVFLVNFFSSWCGPCRAEHPLLMKLKEITPIIGINYMDDSGKARDFLKKLGNPYSDIVVDQQGKMEAILGVDSIPRTMLVVDGRIVYAHSGLLKQEEVDTGLMPVLKQYQKSAGLQAF